MSEATPQSLWDFIDLRDSGSWTCEERQAHQARALSRLRDYTYGQSPFYQRFHRGLTDRPLEELPVLTKAVMMERFDDLVTDRAVRRAELEAHWYEERDELFLGRYWLSATSGSSGRLGLFLQDRDEQSALCTSFVAARLAVGKDRILNKQERVASVTCSAGTSIGEQLARAAKKWSGAALNMDAREPLGSIVERLNAWQPETLTVYPSVAAALAEEQLSGRLRIAPTRIQTTGEILTRGIRRRLIEAWGEGIFDLYGSTEAGLLAAECHQHRGLHLIDNLFIAEVVDANNDPVPAGLFGEKVLITVLFRQTQPLIRYELSDRVRLAQELCPCGSSYRLIAGIQGRTWEVLSMPTLAGGTVEVPPIVFDYALEGVPAEWQVVQEPDGLRVLLSNVRGELDEASLVKDLRTELAALGAVPPPISFQRVATIPRTAGAKAPLVRSSLPRPPIEG